MIGYCPVLSAAILNWLWVDWAHRGRVTFTTPLELLSLSLEIPEELPSRTPFILSMSSQRGPYSKGKHEPECKKSHPACNNATSSTEEGRWLVWLSPPSSFFLPALIFLFLCIYCQLGALHNRERRLECIETTGT